MRTDRGMYISGHGREEARAEEAIRRRPPKTRDRMLAQLRRRAGEVLPPEAP